MKRQYTRLHRLAVDVAYDLKIDLSPTSLSEDLYDVNISGERAGLSLEYYMEYSNRESIEAERGDDKFYVMKKELDGWYVYLELPGKNIILALESNKKTSLDNKIAAALKKNPAIQSWPEKQHELEIQIDDTDLKHITGLLILKYMLLKSPNGDENTNL